MKANQVDKERIGTVQKYLRLQQKLCWWHIHHRSWHSHGWNFAPSSRQRPPAGVLTIEVEVEGKLPFLGMMIIRKENTIHTEVYRKLTDTGLLQHYQSHMDKQYKRSSLRTLLQKEPTAREKPPVTRIVLPFRCQWSAIQMSAISQYGIRSDEGLMLEMSAF